MQAVKVAGWSGLLGRIGGQCRREGGYLEASSGVSAGDVPPRVLEELAALVTEAELAKARVRGYLDAVIATQGLSQETAVRLRAVLSNQDGGVVPSGGAGNKSAALLSGPPGFSDKQREEKDGKRSEDQHDRNQRQSSQGGVESHDERDRRRDTIPANLPEGRFP